MKDSLVAAIKTYLEAERPMFNRINFVSKRPTCEEEHVFALARNSLFNALASEEPAKAESNPAGPGHDIVRDRYISATGIKAVNVWADAVPTASDPIYEAARTHVREMLHTPLLANAAHTRRAASLLEAAEPLIEWLNDNAGAHCSVHVTTNTAELLEGQIAVRTDKYIKD